MNTLENPTKPDLNEIFERRAERVMQSVDDYHDYLLSYVFSLTNHWQDAENIVQDLWQHVVLHFKEDDIRKIGFLRRKAFQIFVDHFRYQKRRAADKMVPESTLMRLSAPPVVERFSDAEEKELQENFWKQFPNINLSDLQKRCVWEHSRHGKTYEELSQEHDIPKSTISMRIRCVGDRVFCSLRSSMRVSIREI